MQMTRIGLALASICFLAADASALTLTSGIRGISVEFADTNGTTIGDPGDPTNRNELILEGESFTKSLTTEAGAVDLFGARIGMLPDGVFGIEAELIPGNLFDNGGDPFPATLTATVSELLTFENKTSEPFAIETSFFVSGGEFNVGFAAVNNSISYELTAGVLVGDGFSGTGIFEGDDFSAADDFTENGDTLGATVEADGKLSFPLSDNAAADETVAPGDSISLVYRLVITLRSDGNTEGLMSFIFQDPLGLNGLPTPGGTPGLSAVVAAPTTAAVPLPPAFAFALVGAGAFVVAARRRRRMRCV